MDNSNVIEKNLGTESQKLNDLREKGNNPQSKWSELKKKLKELAKEIDKRENKKRTQKRKHEKRH